MIKKNKDNFDKGYLFLLSAERYLHLVENVLEKNVEQGNIHTMFGNKDFVEKEYEKITKWSDFNISRPIFFVFYHGLELLLKGFILFNNNYKSKHYITEILREFKKFYPEEKEVIFILEKYLNLNKMPIFLSQCLKENNLDINKLYEFFRYPFDKEIKKEYKYSLLEYQEKEGLVFFKEFKDDVKKLLEESVKIYRKMEKINEQQN